MRGLVVRLGVAAVLALAVAPIAAEGPPAAARAESAWVDVLEHLPELLQLTALDPNLASSLIPAEWIDLFVAATFAVAREKATVPQESDPPQLGPLGPWPNARAFVRSVEATDPAAVAALFEALRPAIGLRCHERGKRIGDFDRAMRDVATRLASDAPIERASSAQPTAVTPTQREFARLGVPAILVVRKQVVAIGNELWGSEWSGSD